MTTKVRHEIFRYVILTSVFVAFSLMFWPFATAILLAAMFAFALQDWVSKMEARNINRRTASLILMTAILLFIALPITFIILKTVSAINDYSDLGFKNTEAFKWTMQIIHQAQDALNTVASSIGLNISALSKPTEFLTNHVGAIGGWATAFVTGIPGILVGLVVFMLALFYFLNDSKQIKKTFMNWNLLSESEANQMIKVIKGSSYLTLISSLVVAATQAFVITVFAYFCGFEEFFVVYIFTFIFALVPVVGCAPPSFFLILVSFVNDKPGAAIAMIVAFLIASTSDNIIKAYLLKSANDSIHPIISLLALIGAIYVYGPAGILLGPILTQLAFKVIPILSRNGDAKDA
jgi:predicted PurR-regulated permease PerM